MNHSLLIINQARTWLGTRFQHQGRIKKTTDDKGGVDCIGLIIGVANELGIKLPNHTNYSRFPEQDLLLQLSHKYLQSQIFNKMEISDIVLFRIEQHAQHFGIISKGMYGLSLIHSYAPLKQVVEHHFSPFWQERIVAIFKFPECK